MTSWDDEAGKGDWREEVVSQFSTGWFENRASLGGWRMSQVAIAGTGSRQGSRRAKVEVGLSHVGAAPGMVQALALLPTRNQAPGGQASWSGSPGLSGLAHVR